MSLETWIANKFSRSFSKWPQTCREWTLQYEPWVSLWDWGWTHRNKSISYIVSSKCIPQFSTLHSLNVFSVRVASLKLMKSSRKGCLTFKILLMISYTVKLFSALVQSHVVTWKHITFIWFLFCLFVYCLLFCLIWRMALLKGKKNCPQKSDWCLFLIHL